MVGSQPPGRLPFGRRWDGDAYLGQYNAGFGIHTMLHCHPVPSTEVVYIQMQIASLFPSMEVYETQIWLPDGEPDSVPEQQKTETKQGKVEANQHRDQGTYYIHIAHPQTHTDKRNLTAALSETAEWLKKTGDWMIFSTKPPWMPIGLPLPLALWLGKQLTHTRTHIHEVASHFDQGILTESVDYRRPTGPGFALGFLFWPLCRLKRPVSL